MSDLDAMRAIHNSASINDVETRLREDQQDHLEAAASPARDIFQKTFALISALQDSGCRAPLQEQTVLSEKERHFREKYAAHKAKIQRGNVRSNLKKICEGRVLLRNVKDPKPYISYAFSP
jgi:hypothetical protein